MAQSTQSKAQEKGGDGRTSTSRSQKTNGTPRRANGKARRAPRRAQESLISERASRYSIAEPDWQFMERQKYFWNPLMDYWFRMQMEGWERIPKPPTLLVGIHSGAPLVWDAWTVGVIQPRTTSGLGMKAAATAEPPGCGQRSARP